MTNRKGKSGRKPYKDPKDKKVRVEFYITYRNLEGLGGKDKAREIALRACERN